MGAVLQKSDASGLALVYQEKTADGQKSNFNKLVHPENAKPAAKKRTERSARQPAAKKAPAKKSAAKTTAAARGAKSSRSSIGRK